MPRGDQPTASSGQSPFAAEAVTQAVAGHRQGAQQVGRLKMLHQRIQLVPAEVL